MDGSQNVSRFVGRGISFRDIVIDGKHGGRKGLLTYLRRRVSQLTRDLTVRDAADQSRHLRSIVAMNEAIVLIENSSRSERQSSREVRR